MNTVNIPAKFDPGYDHAPFLRNLIWAFVRMDPVNVPAKFEVRSFTRSWDNSGYLKKLWAVPGYAAQGRPRSLILVPIETAYVISY